MSGDVRSVERPNKDTEETRAVSRQRMTITRTMLRGVLCSRTPACSYMPSRPTARGVLPSVHTVVLPEPPIPCSPVENIQLVNFNFENQRQHGSIPNRQVITVRSLYVYPKSTSCEVSPSAAVATKSAAHSAHPPRVRSRAPPGASRRPPCPSSAPRRLRGTIRPRASPGPSTRRAQ